MSASAQPPQDPSSQPPLVLPRTAPMSLAEYQGVSCAVVGMLAGLGALAYLNPLTAAAAGLGSPLLVVPVLATGFTVGCSVGSTLSPAFLWFYRRTE